MRCIGYGETEGKCKNQGLKNKTNCGAWCESCNKIRLEAIDKQFADMMDRFGEGKKK